MSLVSLYDAASLWMTPSGAEDGKLFSQLPTDGSGDFTFSRGSNLAATRVGPTGLIEKGRENLLPYSNAFTSGDWQDTGASYFTSGQSGYDGTNDAWRFTTVNQGERFQIVSSVVTGKTGVHTLSAYFKKGTADGVRMRVDMSGTDANIYVNLLDGNIFNSVGDIAAKLTDIGGGWYRAELTANWVNVLNIRIYPTNTTGNDAVGTIYIQSAQLEIGLAATDYIESGATTGKAGLLENEPRLDYSGGATCPSLLLEPSRTNLVPFSEYWKGYFTIDTDVTISVNVATSPEGVQNAGRLKYDLASRSMYKSAMGLTGEHSVSFWVKGDGSNIGKTFNLRLQGTSIDQNIPITLTSDWVRVEAQTNGLNILELNNRNSTTIDTGSLLLYGFQIEQASYPTSYIPNHSGGSVTRGIDECTGAGDATTFNSAEGVLYFEGKVQANPNFSPNSIGISDGTDANRVSIIIYGNLENIRSNMNVGGVTQFDFNLTGYTQGQYYKIAVSYKANDCKIFINGTKISIDTSATMPSLGTFDRLNLDLGNGLYDFHGNAKQLLYFPTALTDSECIALTKLD